MNSKKYTPFFCEENIWHLLNGMNKELLAHTSILFITNEYKTCALLNQKASKVDEYIIWDYHVILHDLDTNSILDYDTLLNFNTPINEYFYKTFGEQSYLPAQYRSKVISIPGNNYLTQFSSSRSHMLDECGNQLKEFPNWPAIQNKGPLTLENLMNLSPEILNDYKTFTIEQYLKANSR